MYIYYIMFNFANFQNATLLLNAMLAKYMFVSITILIFVDFTLIMLNFYFKWCDNSAK